MMTKTPVLRLCPINPRTTSEDIRETIGRLDALRQTATVP